MDLAVPTNLAVAAAAEGREDWLAGLPTTVAHLRRRWDLDIGAPFEPGGNTSWVAPARDAAGRDLVVKVLWRHTEAEHEADALRLWDGAGAVRVHARDDVAGGGVPGDGPHGKGDTVALLLERCRPGTLLRARPEPEQDDVVVALLPRLWRSPPAGHSFRPLQVMCDEWADEFEQKRAAGRVDLDPGLARAGVHLLRTLPGSSDRSVLLCTDLHAGNILAAEREPWLVIDPKPYVGDPAYDPLQHMLNCRDRLRADPVDLTTRLADLLGLDRERLLLWLFARCVQESPDWPGLADVARRLAPR